MFALKVLKITRINSINLRSLNKQLIHSSNIQFIKKVHDSEYEFFSKHVYSSREIGKFSGNIENSNARFKKSFDLNKNQSENLLNELDFLTINKNSVKFDKLQENFSDSFQKIVENIQYFTDDQLINLLKILQKIFTKTAGEKTTEDSCKDEFNNLLTKLDEICCERGQNWSKPLQLKALNLCFKMKFHSKFIETALSRMRRGFPKLPKDIFIETLFYLTTCRRNIPLSFLEERMNGMFDELTANEIGIFCMSLHKNDVWIKDIQIVHKLYDKTFAEIDSIEEITLQYFLKQLRVSSEADHVERLKELCDVLLHRIDHYSLKTCLHVGMLGTNSEYCHQKLIEAVVKRFNKEIDQAIVKNFTELTFLLSHFNFKTESGIEKELMTKIIKELKLRVDEVVKVPRTLPIAMSNLAMCGIHDDEILRTVLTEKFYRFAYGKQRYNIGPEILSLDSYTRINLKDVYDGPQLSSMIRSCIMRGQLHVPPIRDKNLKVSEKVLYDIKDLMEQKYGKNIVTNILPHFKRSDIVFCFDENLKSVTEKIIDCFPPVFSGEIASKDYLLSKKPELSDKFDKLELIAVILGYSNFFLLESNRKVSELETKIKQLEMIGYKTVVIKWDDWFNSRYEERIKLIDGEIQKALRS